MFNKAVNQGCQHIVFWGDQSHVPKAPHIPKFMFLLIYLSLYFEKRYVKQNNHLITSKMKQPWGKGLECRPCSVRGSWGSNLDPRSQFDRAMRGEMLISSGNRQVFNLQAHISRHIYRIETKPWPACSPLNSEQNGVLFRPIYRIFVMYSIQERKRNPHRINRPRANLVKARIDIQNG